MCRPIPIGRRSMHPSPGQSACHDDEYFRTGQEANPTMRPRQANYVSRSITKRGTEGFGVDANMVGAKAAPHPTSSNTYRLFIFRDYRYRTLMADFTKTCGGSVVNIPFVPCSSLGLGVGSHFQDLVFAPGDSMQMVYLQESVCSPHGT
jgi:hypothetical protein